jgi:hypothetical protein
MSLDRQCTATRGDGQRCTRWAIAGGNVCTTHGGAAPQVKAAAKRRLAEDRARRRLDEVEVTPIGNPVEAFATLVAEAVALKDTLASHVASLERLEVTDRNGAENVRAVLGAYERAMDRSGRLLTDWVRLGLDELKIRVDHTEAELLVDVINDTLRDLGLRPDDEHVARVVAANLRATRAPKLDDVAMSFHKRVNAALMDLVLVFVKGVTDELGIDRYAARETIDRWIYVLDGSPPPLQRPALAVVDVEEVDDDDVPF